MSESERLAPHSVEAEEALLGSILISPDFLDDLAQQIEADDFFIIRNGFVWAALVALYERGDDIDTLTLTDELRQRGQFDDVGGAAYLTYLVNHTPSSIYATAYGSLVERAAFRRDVQGKAQELYNFAQNSGDASDLREAIGETLAELEASAPTENTYLPGYSALEYYRDIMKARTSHDAPELLTMPYEAFAHCVSGIKRGKVVLVSGFSGEGKTLLLENLADWWAMLGNGIFYITTELTREDMLDRLTCRHTGIPYEDVVSRGANVENVMRHLSNEVGEWLPKIDYWETNGASARLIYAQIRRAVRAGKRLIFIDYLSEAVGFETKGRELKDAIDGFFRTIHTYAKQTNTTFVIASQQSNTDHGPTVFGSSIPNQKSALHIRLETSKATESRIYTVDDRLIAVREGNPSPMMAAVIEKNNFGPTGDKPALFKDGARFRFLDESQISSTLAFGDQDIERAQIAHEEARRPKQRGFSDAPAPLQFPDGAR